MWPLPQGGGGSGGCASWWKHEQQTVRISLSAAAHHSFDKVAAGETFNALRGQMSDRARREVEERELHDAPRRQKPPPPGTRPAPLVEVRPQGAMVQHSGIGFELLQALDVPVLQMVEQPVDVDSFFRIFRSCGCRAGYRSAQACLSCSCCSARRLCLSRSWWNSWWKCRLCCPIPCSSSGLPSRSSIFRFRAVEEVLVEVFKVFPQGHGSTASVGKQTIVPARGGLQGLGEQTIVPVRGGL